MKKVTILALHLGYGGGEKAIINLANYLSVSYEVEIISVYKLYDNPAFSVSDRVKIKYLIEEKPNREMVRKCLLSFDFIHLIKELVYSMKVLYKRRKYMKKAIKECRSDIIISSRILFNKWMYVNKNKNSIKIAWEHNHHNDNKRFIKRLAKSCKNVVHMVSVSSFLADYYRDKVKGCSVVYIPNIIERQSEYSELSSNSIITIGRLEPEKGILDLIDIFNDILKDNPECILNIVGDGSQRKEIEKKINDYGISNSVIMHGYRDTDYINNLLMKQSLFVMTSYQESFGIVLVEAMNKGIPCVAFDSAQGAKEIIKDNYNGFLIENRNKKVMVDKIKYLLENDREIHRLGKNALARGKEFEPNEVIKMWEKLFYR